MPKYRIRYYEEVGGWLYFEAATDEEAKAIHEDIEAGNLFDDDAMFEKSTKFGQTTYEELEQVNDAGMQMRRL